MEARQGDPTAVRYLFKRGLEASPRSRYLHLAWATWEAEQGRRSFARKLLQRGHEANRRDPAILQVGTAQVFSPCSTLHGYTAQCPDKPAPTAPIMTM